MIETVITERGDNGSAAVPPRFCNIKRRRGDVIKVNNK